MKFIVYGEVVIEVLIMEGEGFVLLEGWVCI